MKIKIKRVVIPIFLSIIFGLACGKLVYNIYGEETGLAFGNNKIYLLQSGAYSSYDSMRASTVGYNYVYYLEDDLYKAIIGVTKDENNIEKIKDVYKEEVVINEYYLNDDEINDELKKYDLELAKANEMDKIKEIILNMLNLYKKEDIKLTKMG